MHHHGESCKIARRNVHELVLGTGGNRVEQVTKIARRNCTMKESICVRLDIHFDEMGYKFCKNIE